MLDTLTNLKLSVADLLNRQDLTGVIPDWITLVEAECQRILEGQPMRTVANVTFGTSGVVSLPSDFVRGETLTVETNTYKVSVSMKPYDYVQLKRGQLAAGVPLYAATVNTTLYVAPVPDGDYTGVLVYDAQLQPLTSGNPTNWVLTQHPDVYLYGCAYHSAPYLKNDDRLPTWEKLYRTALEQIRIARDKAEYGSNTPVVRPVNVLGV